VAGGLQCLADMTEVVCALTAMALAASDASLQLRVRDLPVQGALSDEEAAVLAPEKLRLGQLSLRKGANEPRRKVPDVFARSTAMVDRELSAYLPRWLVTSGSRALKLAATGYLANEMRKLSFRPDKPVRLEAPVDRYRGSLAERAEVEEHEGRWSIAAMAIGVGVLAAGGGLLWWEANNPGQPPPMMPTGEGPAITGLRISLAGEGEARFMLRGRW
jgi:hypothetical protein